MTNVYDQWHASQDVDNTDTPWHGLVRRYLDLARDIHGQRLLEIGCGRGGFASWLAGVSSSVRVTAIDYSPVAIEQARRHTARNSLLEVGWEVGDIQAIGRPDSSFDTVISCETIEHVPDSRKAVQELARVLTRGGRLFLTSPNYLGPFGLYRGFLRLTGRRFAEVGQPINQFTTLPQTLSWVREAGLVPEVVAGVGHYLLFPGREPRRLGWLDRLPLKWVALHGIIVARKP